MARGEGVEAAPRGPRSLLKSLLARGERGGPARGASLLIYHRVGGGTTNELDVSPAAFGRHLDLLDGHDVVSLDAALDRLDTSDERPTFVITFDDGFADIHENAWPLLRARSWPFTVYLATAYMGDVMVWEGATATGTPGRGLTWEQLREMVDSGLCTIGNHTHRHVRPAALTTGELDDCTEAIEKYLGTTPRHFAYPWGEPVPGMEDALRARFRSASTGGLGRNLPALNPLRVHRIPVRRTDPDAFFAAKLRGDLWPERVYGRLVGAGKSVLRPAQRFGANSA